MPAGLRVLRKLPIPRKLGLLGRIYGKTLEQKGVVWVKTSPGPVWKLDLRNSTHRWIVFGAYEGPGFLSWARSWVEEDSTVVDSGTNIGQVLLYLAPKIRTGRYLAFEPFPPARAWLNECLRRYPDWRVEVQETGLGEKAGTASLEGQWGGEEAVGSHTELKIGAGSISIITLDSFFKENPSQTIRLWKLDMEGGEEAGLKGAEDLLRRGRIEALVVETDKMRVGGLCNYLSAFGFSPRNWSGRAIRPSEIPVYGNLLFLPKK